MAVFALPAAANSRGMNGRIAFTTGALAQGHLTTVRPDGSGRVSVAIDCGCLLSTHSGLSWSPSGQDLLLVGFFGGGGDQIVRSGLDGSAATDLSPPCAGATSTWNGSCDDHEPVYSPDSTSIAFARGVPVTHRIRLAIFTMNANGTNPTQLTTPKGWDDRQPVWSPNGKEIAFVRTDTTATPRNESAIEVMNADGGRVRRLTPFRLDAGDPQWSPNGKLILFSTHALSVGKSANLYTMRPDGAHRVALTHYTAKNLKALANAWSPDGTHILFNRVAGSFGHFYIMNLRTRQTRELTAQPTGVDDRAAWGRSSG
jgi:Tol biopolymer transport system component